jgi:predicted DNA-binding protein
MKKTKQIAVRLDDETLQKLHRLQKETGLSQSELFRQFIHKGKVTSCKQKNNDDIFLLIGAVNKVGNNINQIALKLNYAYKQRSLDEIDYEQIMNELKEINDTLKNLIEIEK